MKNLKYMSLMLALLCVVSLGFTSCGDDDDDDELPALRTILRCLHKHFLGVLAHS